jgi:carbamoyltransferase
VDHHRCHALAAALLAPFDESITVTLDGLGDGLSGTISRFSKGKQEVLSLLPAADSLGIFFEQVTYLLNMRELEDEGKVMALADYAPPLKPQDNPLRDFFRVEGLDVRCRHTPGGMLEALRRVHWRTSAEEFARMAQDTLEEHACALVRNALESAPCLPLCFAGGVASNIRLNLRLRHCAGDRGWFVFPHMGDGGLALGAALHANLVERGIARYEWEDVSWGSSFSEEEILKEVSSRGLPHRRVRDAARIAASYIAQGEIVFWFQGRMEYGPRALGNRSILAPAGSRDARDRLNLLLKRRNWFQPFCPSMMTEEAERLIEDYDGFPARFMTMGYKVRPEWRERLAAVVSVEGSMRPQMVDPGPGRYRALLEEVKRLTGAGIILNTSFNRHGEPLVRTPAEALDTFTRVGGKHMVMEDILVACSAEDLKDPGEPAEYCVSGKGG